MGSLANWSAFHHLLRSLLLKVDMSAGILDPRGGGFRLGPDEQ